VKTPGLVDRNLKFYCIFCVSDVTFPVPYISNFGEVASMSEHCRPVSRSSNIIVQEVNDEHLVYDLERDQAFCLNETSARIWKLCDGTRSIPDLTEALTFDLRKDVSESVVRLGLDQLSRNKLLLSDCGGITTEGRSRREAIRQIGLSSMIALPVVYSLVAPTAVHAQSCGMSGAACSVPGNCCLGSNCGGVLSVCCGCITPGDCIVQTSCPSTVNCNGSGICAP
jgi:hypothetical protein